MAIRFISNYRMNVNKSKSEIELAERPIDQVEQIAHGKGQEKTIIPEISRTRDMTNVIMTGRKYIMCKIFTKIGMIRF